MGIKNKNKNRKKREKKEEGQLAIDFEIGIR